MCVCVSRKNKPKKKLFVFCTQEKRFFSLRTSISNVSSAPSEPVDIPGAREMNEDSGGARDATGVPSAYSLEEVRGVDYVCLVFHPLVVDEPLFFFCASLFLLRTMQSTWWTENERQAAARAGGGVLRRGGCAGFCVPESGSAAWLSLKGRYPRPPCISVLCAQEPASHHPR